MVVRLRLAVRPSLQTTDIQFFHLFPGPGRFAQKSEARFDAGVFDKTIDADAPAQFFPPKMGNEVVEDGFQCFAVQRVV